MEIERIRKQDIPPVEFKARTDRKYKYAAIYECIECLDTNSALKVTFPSSEEALFCQNRIRCNLKFKGIGIMVRKNQVYIFKE